MLLLRGNLKPGTHLICGTTQAKVRSITSPPAESTKTILPGFAAVVSGWKELPNAGDEVLSASESDIKRAIANRIRKAEIESSLEDMEAINVSRKEEREKKEAEEVAAKEKKRLFASGITAEEPEVDEGRKEVRVVVKADVSGSSEAVAQAFAQQAAAPVAPAPQPIPQPRLNPQSPIIPLQQQPLHPSTLRKPLMPLIMQMHTKYLS